MRQIKIITLTALVLLCSCSKSDKSRGNSKTTGDYTQFVDPYIGSDYHGHVFVGANVPFGMVQVGPTNLSKGWDWVSGYHYSDSIIIGFAMNHLSGTGIGDLGDFLFMPQSGAAHINKGGLENLEDSYISKFSHANEQVRPGYYKVLLDKSKVEVELTATARVGLHRYHYPDNAAASILLDLGEGIDWDAPTQTGVEQIDDTTFQAYRYSKGWAKDQRVYMTARLSQPIENFSIIDAYVQRGRSKDSILVKKALISFAAPIEGKIDMKVGLSYVSSANALLNMEAELPGWNFEAVRSQATALWNEQLAKIDYQTAIAEDKTTFYTALFHTCISPSLFVDVNGEYRGADGKTHTAQGFEPHTTFSLWDTYRALHPLYTLTQGEKIKDFINSFLAIYEQQGKLPVWHLVGNETDCMVGYHAVPVIVDAYMKGYRDFDVALAFEAMKSFSMSQERGLSFVNTIGYIPADKEEWSVAKALEYAIDDYAIAVMAKELGKEEDYKFFLNKSKNYRHYFDPAVGFMRGKLADGSWRANFDPSHSLHREDDFVEGNAWQYTWLVPHDVDGLIDLFGSKDAFINKLDSLFLVSSELNEGASMDITGLIGQYAHGNEPSHSTLYLYASVGQQWKTAEKVRQVLREFYSHKPDGIIGNEDCGQMSAWYIFSSMGLYPLNPVDTRYVFGSPLASSAKIRLPNGKIFSILATNNSESNIYIQEVKRDGKPYTLSYITHQDMMKGGELEFIMGSSPVK